MWCKLSCQGKQCKGICQGLAGQELINSNLRLKLTEVFVSLVINSFYG